LVGVTVALTVIIAVPNSLSISGNEQSVQNGKATFQTFQFIGKLGGFYRITFSVRINGIYFV